MAAFLQLGMPESTTKGWIQRTANTIKDKHGHIPTHKADPNLWPFKHPSGRSLRWRSMSQVPSNICKLLDQLHVFLLLFCFFPRRGTQFSSSFWSREIQHAVHKLFQSSGSVSDGDLWGIMVWNHSIWVCDHLPYLFLEHPCWHGSSWSVHHIPQLLDSSWNTSPGGTKLVEFTHSIPILPQWCLDTSSDLSLMFINSFKCWCQRM